MFIFERERERESASAWAGEEQREGDTESEAGFRLWAVSTEPNVGLEPTNCELMTRAEIRRSTDWATQAPLYFIFWERERAQAGEGQRETHTQNPKQASGSELSAQSPTRGRNPRTVRSRPEPKSDTQPTEPPRHADFFFFLSSYIQWLNLQFKNFFCIFYL